MSEAIMEYRRDTVIKQHYCTNDNDIEIMITFAARSDPATAVIPQQIHRLRQSSQTNLKHNHKNYFNS